MTAGEQKAWEAAVKVANLHISRGSTVEWDFAILAADAVIKKAQDVGTLARVMSNDSIAQRESVEYEGHTNLVETARALRDYLMEGKEVANE